MNEKKKMNSKTRVYEVDYEDTPPQFICPISLQIMKNPVICQDGHTYERESILAIKQNISPMTRLPIDKNILIENINIRQLIEEFIESKQKKYKTQLYESQLYELQQRELEDELKYKTQLYEIKQKKQELIIKEQLYEMRKKEYELKIKENKLSKQIELELKEENIIPEPELTCQNIVSEPELKEENIISEPELTCQNIVSEPELTVQHFLEQEKILNCTKQEIIEKKMNYCLLGKKIMIYGLKSIHGRQLNNKFGIIIEICTSLYRVELLENISKSVLLKIENIKLIE